MPLYGLVQHTFVIPVSGRLKQEDHESMISLGLPSLDPDSTNKQANKLRTNKIQLILARACKCVVMMTTCLLCPDRTRNVPEVICIAGPEELLRCPMA